MTALEGSGKLAAAATDNNPDRGEGGTTIEGQTAPPPHLRLREVLKALGLNSSQARVLSTLLLLEKVHAKELPRMAEVPRTSVYSLLEELRTRGLASPVPRDGPALWMACGPGQVVERLRSAQLEKAEAAEKQLVAAHQQGLREVEDRREQIRSLADELGRILTTSPFGGQQREPQLALPHLRILSGLTRFDQAYRRQFAEVQSEVMVLNRGPYGEIGVLPVILDALRRGVRVRALYMEAEIGAASPSFLEGLAQYHAAGVEARVVDDIPVAISVFDRGTVLYWLDDPVSPAPGIGTPVVTDHPDFGAAMSRLFEQFWAESRPYPDTAADTGRGADVGDDDVEVTGVAAAGARA